MLNKEICMLFFEKTCIAGLCVSWLFFCVNMPDDVVGQTDNFVSRSLGHLRKTFCFGLVLERVAWEVDTYAC